MAIKFKRDKDGNVIAVDDKGKKIGSVDTMGDNVKKEDDKKK
jgi:hypothetical protein